MSNEKTIKRHFVLTDGRSGSNYLINTLNKHPQIVNYGEVLGDWTLPYKLYRTMKWTGIKSREYIDLLYGSTSLYYLGQIASAISHIRNREKINFKLKSNIRNIGIKDFSFLLEKRGLLNYLSNASDIYVIHLYRNNILKRYISLVRMQKTGIVKTKSKVSPVKLYIDINDMLKKIAIFEREKELGFMIADKIPKNRLMTISYEDYFNSAESISLINSRIFKFLSVQPIDIKSSQKKIGNDNLKMYIANYNEIKHTLNGTKYEKYLM